MDQWIQLTIDGITLGGVYAVIALGYTLVYGVLRMINFAHGELFMMGAFAGFYTLDAFENHSNLNDAMPSLTIAVAIFAGMATAVVVAIIMERIAYRPLRHAPRLAPLISAIGVSILLRNIMLRVTDARRQVYPQVFPRGRVEFLHDWFDVNVTYIRLFLVLLSILFLVLLYVFIQRTKTGTAIRAVAEDRDTAALMGINVDRTIVLTFVSGAALAGAAGVCYGMFITNASHNMGFIPGIKAFTAAVLGGIGSVPGAMAGGYFLGLSESYATRLIGAQYKDVVAFVLLVGVLIFRPRGIFGKREDRRA